MKKLIALAFVAALFPVLQGWGATSPYIPTVLIVDSDEEVAELESRGVIIWHRREDMVLCAVPRALGLEAATRSGDSDSGSLQPGRAPRERRAVRTMDVARPLYGADKIQTGEGLSMPYTGVGVVVGFVDSGFDPNHIAFLDSEGVSRVKYLVSYDEPNGVRTVVDTEDAIAAYTTDLAADYHGTHVANIMTGSYADAGYSGMAPGAEIAAGTSMLYDAGILAACEDIIAYAQSVGKPVVINMSLGCYNGPHDGTSLFNRYLDMLTDEAIFFLAAGNEGQHGNTYSGTFTSTDNTWRGRIGSSDWAQFTVYGMTDIWSVDSRPIGVRIHVYDEDTAEAVYTSDWLYGPDEYYWYTSTDTDTELARYITGAIAVSGYQCELNNRWVTEITYNTSSTEAAAAGNWARREIAFEVTGDAGVEFDVTSDGEYSRLMKWPGYGSIGNDLSISDLCCGRNIVTVGMYNTKNTVETLGNGTKTYAIDVGYVSPNSSYATLRDGRTLPHTVAPGAGVVSACSRYYLETYPSQVAAMCDVSDVGGNKYYWAFQTGTSMATPYTAGVVATWLEAIPTLTVSDVLEALMATNLTDVPNPEDPRHGYGWLQPYEGLKYLLASSGIEGVAAGATDAAAPAISFSGNTVEILNPSAVPVSAMVYDLAGVCRASLTSGATVASLDLSSLPRGTYIVRAQAAGANPTSRKIIL